MNKLKKLYLDSITEFKVTKNLAICGLMAALAIVLNYAATIDIGPHLRIGFSGLPNRIVEFLFGPVIGCFFGGALDILKFITKPNGMFFPGFTFNAMLAGVIYGFILYRKPISIKRIFIAEILIKIIVNICLNTLWLYVLMGNGVLADFPLRIGKNIIMIPIDAIILFFTLTFINAIYKRTK